ncbi:MAG: hypothetical protein J6K29_00125 [Clostridia bacterium]|nr:hypothetical protein [Clostridia bacterium]
MQELLDSLTDPLWGLLQFFPFLLSVAAYVFQGLYLTSLCRASGRGSVWMAWVPFANLYLLGLMADVYTDTYFPTGIPGDPEDASPSALRRRMLGFSIVSHTSGAIAAAALAVFAITGIAGFFLLLFSWGEAANDPDVQELVDVFRVSLPIFLVAGAVWVVFEILYLVAFCKSHYRVCALIGMPMPALWTLLGIVIPLVPAILLFVRSRDRVKLTARFYPYAEENAPNSDSDAEPPPPAEPPLPELYPL